MPLILAIEPDPKQAARLTALAKKGLDADLVTVTSAAHALDVLVDRQPDLILTSMLLSVREEAFLADRLRELDASGRRVQTLVIPMLGTSSTVQGEPKGDGLLTRLRRPRGRAAPVTTGCDPDIFAAQIEEYLERATSERMAAAHIETPLYPAYARPEQPSIVEPAADADRRLPSDGRPLSLVEADPEVPESDDVLPQVLPEDDRLDEIETVVVRYEGSQAAREPLVYPAAHEHQVEPLHHDDFVHTPVVHAFEPVVVDGALPSGAPESDFAGYVTTAETVDVHAGELQMTHEPLVYAAAQGSRIEASHAEHFIDGPAPDTVEPDDLSTMSIGDATEAVVQAGRLAAEPPAPEQVAASVDREIDVPLDDVDDRDDLDVDFRDDLDRLDLSSFAETLHAIDASMVDDTVPIIEIDADSTDTTLIELGGAPPSEGSDDGSIERGPLGYPVPPAPEQVAASVDREIDVPLDDVDDRDDLDVDSRDDLDRLDLSSFSEILDAVNTPMVDDAIPIIEIDVDSTDPALMELADALGHEVPDDDSADSEPLVDPAQPSRRAAPPYAESLVDELAMEAVEPNVPSPEAVGSGDPAVVEIELHEPSVAWPATFDDAATDNAVPIVGIDVEVGSWPREMAGTLVREAADNEPARRTSPTAEHHDPEGFEPTPAGGPDRQFEASDPAPRVALIDTAESPTHRSPDTDDPSAPAVPLPPLEAHLTVEPPSPTATAVPPGQLEVLEMLSAIRRDLEQMRTERETAPPAVQPAATDVPIAEESSEVDIQAPTRTTPRVKSAKATAQTKKKRKKQPPIQDEWGFFDPDQCGFAALLEKLEEITEEEAPPTTPDTD